MLYTVSGYLAPLAPFDFGKSLAFLAGFMPAQAEQYIGRDSLSKAVFINGQLMVFRVGNAGSVETPRLAYSLFSEQPIDPAKACAAEDRISFFLSLNDDLRAFYALGRGDPAFEPVIERLYGYHQVKFLTPFENACWAMLSQHNPMAVAAQMKALLVKRYGGWLELEGRLYGAFPEPGTLAQAGETEIDATIQHIRKSEYLHAAASAFFSVEEQFLRTAPCDELEAWLRAIRGIGEWSAAFVLTRGLGRTEGLPIEKRLLAAASERYQQRMSAQTLQELGSRYGAWQGYWAHYLRAAA